MPVKCGYGSSQFSIVILGQLVCLTVLYLGIETIQANLRQFGIIYCLKRLLNSYNNTWTNVEAQSFRATFNTPSGPLQFPWIELCINIISPICI